ncbi:hypothetical protein [Anoxynatronum sibiricum]|uniref:BioF2-like acetyltransferase domain-containing protein n=1 Tax=Anoxynatronum sibiricum TaxID=210623 RepID=A0ABU9VTZ9_9CLOT
MFAINHRTKLGFIRIKDLYYAPALQPPSPDIDVIYYYHCKVSGPGSKPFHTLLIDVSREPEALLASFRKSTRNAVRRAMENPHISLEVKALSSLQQSGGEKLEAFVSAYDQFASQKGIQPCNRELVHLLAGEERLALATARLEEEVLCQFLLVEADKKMVAYYGYNTRFSIEEDTEKVSLIGKMNRALDYQCMLYTRESGKAHYDLCGLTLDPENPEAGNVDHYKLGFGGEIATEYHFMQPVTLKGWLFCRLKALQGGIG